MFVCKHTETTEYVKNQPNCKKKSKLHGLITREFLGLRMRNFQVLFLHEPKWNFQICISVSLIFLFTNLFIKHKIRKKNFLYFIKYIYLFVGIFVGKLCFPINEFYRSCSSGFLFYSPKPTSRVLGYNHWADWT